AADIGLGAMLAVVAAGSVLAVPLSFVAAGCLHGLAMLSGGRCDFARSYQTLVLLGAVAPVSALLLRSPVPLLGLLPTAYATFLAVRGLEVLHDAPGMQAWFVVGSFGGLMAAAQVMFQKNISQFERELAHRANLYATGGAKAATQTEQTPSLVDGIAEPAPVLPRALPPDQTPNPYSPDRLAPAQPERRSSLDMVRQAGDDGGLPAGYPGGGDGYPLGAPPGGGAPPANGSYQEMGLGLLGTIQQKIASDPNALKGLPQEQQDKFMQMLNAANKFSSASQRGEKVSAQDQASMQKLFQEMLSGLSKVQQAKAPQGQAPKKRRKKKAKPAEEDLIEEDDGLRQ
ncbi:MAG: hypothetical protein WC728_08775, partial [Elusimicrobiota bacterium]